MKKQLVKSKPLPNGSYLSKKKTLERLQDDNHYYGKFGRRFLSNSGIGKLLNNPKSFIEPQETTLPMVHGRFLHTLVLEPEKVQNFVIADYANRRAKGYQALMDDLGSTEPLILRDEEANLRAMADELLRLEGDMIRHPEAQYEVPAIGRIAGRWWKGKADILTPEGIIDIKTTADMSKFRRSAYNYGYHSQAYIYRKLFGVPMIFLVIDKNTHQVAIFTCSEDFYESGEERAALAVKEWNKFYGPDAFANANDYVAINQL